MTHVQIPDNWHDDPAVLDMPDAAQAGFVRLASWAGSHRTDGALPKSALRACRVSPRSVAAMTAAGLVTVAGDGWQIVNPGRYLFTEWMRRQKSEAGKKGNDVRWSVAPAIAPATLLRSRALIAIPAHPSPSQPRENDSLKGYTQASREAGPLGAAGEPFGEYDQ